MIKCQFVIILLFSGCFSQLNAQELDALTNLKDSLEQAHQNHALAGDFENAVQAISAYNDVRFRWQTLHESLKSKEAKKRYRLDIRKIEIELSEARNAN